MNANDLTLSLLFGSALMYATVVYADDAVVKNLTLDSTGIESLQMNVEAGFLVVRGDGDTDIISVKAEIVDAPKDYVLTLEKRGSKAVLISEIHNERTKQF